MFKRVLVGADDSPTAARAVRAAAELALALGAELHLGTVVAPLSPFLGAATWAMVPAELVESTPMPTEPAPHLRAILDELGCSAGFHAASGDPAECLVAIADSIGADLLVVGNRNMRGMRRVLGSVPNAVADAASCAVLVFDSMSEPDQSEA